MTTRDEPFFSAQEVGVPRASIRGLDTSVAGHSTDFPSTCTLLEPWLSLDEDVWLLLQLYLYCLAVFAGRMRRERRAGRAQI